MPALAPVGLTALPSPMYRRPRGGRKPRRGVPTYRHTAGRSADPRPRVPTRAPATGRVLQRVRPPAGRGAGAPTGDSAGVAHTPLDLGLLQPWRPRRRDALCFVLVLSFVLLIVGRPRAMVGADIPEGRAYRSYFTSDFGHHRHRPHERRRIEDLGKQLRRTLEQRLELRIHQVGRIRRGVTRHSVTGPASVGRRG